MTPEEYKALTAKRPRRNKYNAKRVSHEGINFDSKMEFARYSQLKVRELAGDIRTLSVHPSFPIVIDDHKICVVKGDFAYFENEKRIVEDVKGRDNPLSRLKRKLVVAFYPAIEWRVITK